MADWRAQGAIYVPLAAGLLAQVHVKFGDLGEALSLTGEELDRIVQETSSEDYPVRDILHEIVQSRLFRNK